MNMAPGKLSYQVMKYTLSVILKRCTWETGTYTFLKGHPHYQLYEHQTGQIPYDQCHSNRMQISFWLNGIHIVVEWQLLCKIFDWAV